MSPRSLSLSSDGGVVAAIVKIAVVRVQGAMAGVDHPHLERDQPERGAEQGGDIRLVVDDQDPGGPRRGFAERD